MNRALVTGATGFVGRHLTRHLLDAGWQVDVIVRRNSDRTPLSSEVIVHEHAGSTESMLSILSLAQPDMVFHLASIFLSEHQPADIDRLIHSNILFGTQLVEAMIQTGAMALVNTGTAWQHYEGRDYSPVNLYSATKQAFEDLLQYYVEAHGLRVITLKLHDTYGPDDPRPKLINLLRRVAAEKQPVAMSQGEQLIDLVHVDDVARAFILAGERLMTNQTNSHERYAVSSSQPIALRALVNRVEHVLGYSLSIEWGGRPYRNREVMKTWQGLPLMPGWEPSVAFESGILQVLRNESKNNTA